MIYKTLQNSQSIFDFNYGVNKKGHPVYHGMPLNPILFSFQEEAFPFLIDLIPVFPLPCKVHRIEFNL